MLILRGLPDGLSQVALFVALLLIPAGTWQWPRPRCLCHEVTTDYGR